MPIFLDTPFPEMVSSLWPIALPVLLGLAAIGVLLPRPRGWPTLTGAVLGGAALLAALWFLIRGGGLNPETVLFYAFAAIAITAGILLITQRDPARAALSFALVVLATCGLFLLQAAPFLTAATIIVYAGAIIVTFLFVIMLAQQAGRSDADHRSREPVLASVAGFVLLGAILCTLHLTYDAGRPAHELLDRVAGTREKESAAEIHRALNDGLERDFFYTLRSLTKDKRGLPVATKLLDKIEAVEAEWPRLRRAGDAERMKAALTEIDQLARPPMPAENVAHLGHVLFTDYLLAVELGGTLLLVATIGAIAITARRAEGTR